MSFLRKSLLFLAVLALLPLAPGLASAVTLPVNTAGFSAPLWDDGIPDLYEVHDFLVDPDAGSNAALVPSITSHEIFIGGEYDIAILISSSAARTNDVGIYTSLASGGGDGSGKVDLFSDITGFGYQDSNGDSTGAFQSVAIPDQGDFGLFLHSSLYDTTMETWHSESTLDDDGSNTIDHFVSFALGDDISIQLEGRTEPTALEGALLIGIEDLHPIDADFDYDDFVLVLAKVVDDPSVPEPAESLLVVTGLIGLGLLGRRRQS